MASPRYKKYKNLPAYIFFFLLAGFFLLSGDFNKNNLARAGNGENVTGFAWSENFGWISFNSKDCDIDGNGTVTAGENPPDGCLLGVIPNYGVDIDTNGDFSGFAWSSNLGWISFNRTGSGGAGNPPGQPYQSSGSLAHLDLGTGQVDGWAKALILDADGWIKLRKYSTDTGASYGVSVDTITGQFSGWGWNGNNDRKCVSGTNDGSVCAQASDCPSGECKGATGVGWLSFNCSNTSSCGTSNYKVILTDTLPVAPTMGAISELAACTGAQRAVTVNWADNSTNETGFIVEYKPSGGSWSVYCSVNSNIVSCTDLVSPSADFSFRVKATGSMGDSSWSPGVNGASFATTYCSPANLRDTGHNCSSVNLSWDQSGTGVTSYQILRNETGVAPWGTAIGTVSGSTLTYTDDNISAGKSYYYVVRALDEGYYSNILGPISACPKNPTWREK